MVRPASQARQASITVKMKFGSGTTQRRIAKLKRGLTLYGVVGDQFGSTKASLKGERHHHRACLRQEGEALVA